jgi:hypothetical protein
MAIGKLRKGEPTITPKKLQRLGRGAAPHAPQSTSKPPTTRALGHTGKSKVVESKAAVPRAQAERAQQAAALEQAALAARAGKVVMFGGAVHAGGAEGSSLVQGMIERRMAKGESALSAFYRVTAELAGIGERMSPGPDRDSVRKVSKRLVEETKPLAERKRVQEKQEAQKAASDAAAQRASDEQEALKNLIKHLEQLTAQALQRLAQAMKKAGG